MSLYEGRAVLPVLALRGLVTFPKTLIHLDITEKIHIAAIQDAMKAAQNANDVLEKKIYGKINDVEDSAQDANDALEEKLQGTIDGAVAKAEDELGEAIDKLQDGDKVLITEDVITAGTAVRETVPVLKAAAEVGVTDMFISVNRCEVGQNPGKTAVMEVKDEFGITVHAIVTAQDIHEYLQSKPEYENVLKLMEHYMAKYCVF